MSLLAPYKECVVIVWFAIVVVAYTMFSKETDIRHLRALLERLHDPPDDNVGEWIASAEEDDPGLLSRRSFRTLRLKQFREQGRVWARLYADARATLGNPAYNQANRLAVSRHFRDRAKALNVRDVDIARKLPVLVEAFFLPTEDDLLALEFRKARDQLGGTEYDALTGSC